MSFISTYNNLSVRGWSADSNSGVRYLTSIRLDPSQNNTFIGTEFSTNNEGNLLILGVTLYDQTIGNTTYTNCGAGFVYSGNLNNWNLDQTLQISNINSNIGLGRGTAISGDGNYIFLGINQDQPNIGDIGGIYEFYKSGNTYIEGSKLTSNIGSNSDIFGAAIATDDIGEWLMVCARSTDLTYTNQGAVIVFQRTGNTWAQTQVLTASDANANYFFGQSVAIDGNADYAVIGSSLNSNIGTSQGAAYIFTRSGNTWSEAQKIVGNIVANSQFFGDSVDITNGANTIIVGGPGNAGNLYVFEKTGVNSWTQSTQVSKGIGFTDSNISIKNNGDLSLISFFEKGGVLYYDNFIEFGIINPNNITSGDYADKVKITDDNYIFIAYPGYNVNQGEIQVLKII